MSICSMFYKLSRSFGKVASDINDLETLATLNPKKIGKRIARKKVSKITRNISQSVNNKLK